MVNEFQMRIANTTFACKCETELDKLCKDYLWEGSPEFFVEVNPFMEEMVEEKEFTDREREFAALCRSCSEYFPLKDSMLVHGASISYMGKAFLFIAPPGTGKTTHIKFWKENLDCQIINGDKSIISAEEEIKVYGSPWTGKEGFGSNISERLSAVILLFRGCENSIEKVESKDYVENILTQVYLPKNQEAFEKTIELCNRVFGNIPLYKLQCLPNKEAFELCFEGVLNEI